MDKAEIIMRLLWASKHYEEERDHARGYLLNDHLAARHQRTIDALEEAMRIVAEEEERVHER